MPHHEATGLTLEPFVGRELRTVCDPVQVNLQLDERRISFLEDDVVSDLPILFDELEVVVVVSELELRLC